MMNRDSFVYGFFSALIFISLLLGSQYGDYFNFLKKDGLLIVPSFGEALNWKTLVFVSMLFMFLYKNLEGSFKFKLMNTFMFLVFAWSLNDIIWCVKASFMGNFLFGSSELVYISSKALGIGVTRNALFFFVSSFVALRMLKWSKQVFVSVIVWIVYWCFLFLGFFRDSSGLTVFIPFYNPVYYSMTFLPFIVGFKTWKCKTWMKLVFA